MLKVCRWLMGLFVLGIILVGCGEEGEAEVALSVLPESNQRGAVQQVVITDFAGKAALWCRPASGQPKVKLGEVTFDSNDTFTASRSAIDCEIRISDVTINGAAPINSAGNPLTSATVACASGTSYHRFYAAGSFAAGDNFSNSEVSWIQLRVDPFNCSSLGSSNATTSYTLSYSGTSHSGVCPAAAVNNAVGTCQFTINSGNVNLSMTSSGAKPPIMTVETFSIAQDLSDPNDFTKCKWSGRFRCTQNCGGIHAYQLSVGGTSVPSAERPNPIVDNPITPTYWEFTVTDRPFTCPTNNTTYNMTFSFFNNENGRTSGRFFHGTASVQVQ